VPLTTPDFDLLRAVSTDVAVSSVYRDQRTQVASLVDGDLETAWNSRTGDLAGAWIEVRVPESAEVTAIAMTVGFTRSSREGDLFVGNHRIRRVRVLHGGTVVGEFPLDVESRALQSLPVRGAGGTYRIEIVDVLPGDRAAWRETCVSELRVMGRDAGAHEAQRLPRTAVGALPPPRVVVATPDRAVVGRLQRQRVAAIERSWLALELLANGGRQGSAPDDMWAEDVAEIARLRRAVLTETADFVAQLDEMQGDALRLAALRRIPTEWSEWQGFPQLLDDLAVLARAMDFVSGFLADDAARCRWARALGHLHLARAASFARAAAEHADMDASESGGGRHVNSLYTISEVLTDAEREWSRNTRGIAARVRRIVLPPGTSIEADLDQTRAQIGAAQASCGWER